MSESHCCNWWRGWSCDAIMGMPRTAHAAVRASSDIASRHPSAHHTHHEPAASGAAPPPHCPTGAQHEVVCADVLHPPVQLAAEQRDGYAAREVGEAAQPKTLTPAGAGVRLPGGLG